MKQHTRKHPRSFPVSTLVLFVATLLAATFGAAGSLVTIWPTSPALAVILAGVFLSAPLLATGLASAYTHMSATAKPLAFAVIAILVALDSAANVRSWTVLQDIALKQQAITERTLHEENLEQAQSRLKTAQDKLNAVPLPDAEGQIRRASTYDTVTAPMIIERDAAQEQVDELTAKEFPKAPPIIPTHLAWILFSGLSVSLVAAFGLLADARKSSVKGATDMDIEELSDLVAAHDVQTQDLKEARSKLHYLYKDRKTLQRRVEELEGYLESASKSGGRLPSDYYAKVAND
ncbi:MAG: hypothetical protein ACX94D_08240 [Henriciella sp.]